VSGIVMSHRHQRPNQPANNMNITVVMTALVVSLRASFSRLLIGGLLASILTGCLHHNYYIDPKPRRVSYDDLRLAAHPKPVQLIFDVYNENGPFPEATKKLAPKALDVVTFSGLFSSVMKVGSDNMPRLQFVLTERELPEPGAVATQPVPPTVTIGLSGTEGGVIYTLSATYQGVGQQPIKQVYHHAVHVAGGGPKPPGVKSMRAIKAVEDVVEQMMLGFLIDLQSSGNL
jgi:hypothetical protein